MDTGPVKIYTKNDTTRLRYISSLILGEVLGLPWEITTDKRKIRGKPVINYSRENIKDSFRINPDSLLSEKGISPKNVSVDTWKNMPVLFMSPEDSDFPFDIFAASFYLITRYEEYDDKDPDEHGRFRSSSSIAFKNNFLDKPVVDQWILEFARAFIRKFRNVAIMRSEFRMMLTFDTDEAFASHNKNIFTSIGGIVVGLRSGQQKKEQKDPYDVFDYIDGSLSRSGLDAKFFFPVGDRSKYDKNPSWKDAAYRKLISGISKKYPTGLHPTYRASFRKEMIKEEKARLEEISGMKINSCRFHYLKVKLPFSYRELISLGIMEDYTMGYPDVPGFRAGFSRSYYFYDILAEKQTGLRIFPFQIMDELMLNGNDPEHTRQLIAGMSSGLKSVGGTLTTIWHNTSLLEGNGGRAGRELFEFMLGIQAQLQ